MWPGRTGDVCLVLRTGLVAALVAGVLAAGGCSPSPRCPANAPCPAIPLRVTFTSVINGKPAAAGHGSSYRVRPGEQLVMRVVVTVPDHVKITALWFGISTGTWGSGRGGNPIGMHPILAHYRQPLPPGSHTFGLRWRVSRHRSADSLILIYSWTSHQPPASVSGPIATLTLAPNTRA